MVKVLLKLLFIVTTSFIVRGQEHPPVINYPPHVYLADNQNWMLSQAQDKTIYVANNRGLLSFNGSQWQLYPSPNATIMRAVKAVKDKIYTGAYKDFGVWKEEVTGKLVYHSIVQDKKLEMVEDEHIWNIEAYRQYVIFQSLDNIYIYDSEKNTIQTINPSGQVVRLYLVEDELFFQVRGKGIYSIANGKAILYNDNQIFKDHSVINVFDFKGKLMGVTATKGIYIFDRDTTRLWDKLANSWLEDINVYSAIRRINGSVVLGTIENGIVQFSETGDLTYQIKKDNGLNNNTALALFEDQDQNLWIGLDAGIDCVNSHSQFNQYIDTDGELGTIYAAAVAHGYVYVGTNQGLFYKLENSEEQFVRMVGIEGQVWDLSIIDNTLFCGHNTGTYIISGKTADRIAHIDGTWDIKKIPGQEDLLLQGNFDGLYVLEKLGERWQLRNKVSNFDISSKHFEIPNENTVLVSHEYKGVYELNLDQDFQNAIKVFKHESISTSEHSSLARLRDAIFYATKNGIFKYDNSENKFTQEKELSTIFTNENFVTAKLVEDSDRLWAFTNNELISITQDKLDGSYGASSIPFPIAYRNTVAGYEIFVRFRESEYLLGTSSGYILVDTGANSKQEYNIRLNEISRNDLGGLSQTVAMDVEGDFESRQNNLSFAYSVPEFDKFLTTQYAYKLNGFYDKWSGWATDASVSFENLPHGEYTFEVKGIVGDRETLNQASYSFTIHRPWYISNLAIVVYVILTILLFTALNYFYKRYYKRQQELVLERTKRDLALTTLENEKQIIELNNANLKQDIDARNRELAVSTMNMVNKNKTLNTIKNALLKAERVDDINDIIKIVDTTLENEEDWNFFEKAFNHADKDFFRKVKDLHPSLTANDLKLCVYLRLNMSSKEIAPLLNISSRSVEIKRYRLRKKLEISRDINLNDYFINL